MECMNDTAASNLTCLFEEDSLSFENDTTVAAADLVTVAGGNITDGGSSGLTSAYFLLPILLLEFVLSTFSNVVLLFLIGRYHKSLTTLNVFLLSLGILNLIVSANQIVIFCLVLAQGHPIPSEICHAEYSIQTLGSYGVTFFHLAISYNRYHTTLNPIHWESSLRKAWISITVIWALSILLATLFLIIHVRGIQGDIHYCFWPNYDTNMEFKTILHTLFYVIVLTFIAITAHYYRKTIKLHNENRKALEREMEMTSDIHIYEKDQNSPEKTTKSLVAVFGIQMTAMMIPFSYNILRAFIVAVRSKVTMDNSDPSPTILLLSLTTIGLLMAAGPFSLLIVSRRFKNNVVGMFRCSCKCGLNKVHLENPYTTARASISRRPTSAAPEEEKGYNYFLGNEPTHTYRVSRSSLLELAAEEVMEMQLVKQPKRPYDRSESIRDFFQNTALEGKEEEVLVGH